MTDDSPAGKVTVSDWNVCYNQGDEVIALTCVINSLNGGISGVGLMLNTDKGEILASTYFEFAESESVTPALNLPPGNLKVGDVVNAVASGQANGQHFFFEARLKVVNC